MSPSRPRPTSIRIFLVDGVPEGLRIVEKANWTGRAVVASRPQVDRALSRDELGQPGVYVLTGEGTDGMPRLYVGEADVLRDRLRQHVANKDFWTRLVAFSSSNEGLNKAHVRYLEARLIGLAHAANQWEVENGTQPGFPPLSEADRADAEWFLAEMLVIFPLLGIDAFEAASVHGVLKAGAGADASVLLYLKQRGADATGREVADGFIVLKGSRARAKEAPSIQDFLRNQRTNLVERGVLVPEGNALVFTQDYRFSSPSNASGVIVGASSNGRLAWKDEKGRTLKDIQAEQAKVMK